MSKAEQAARAALAKAEAGGAKAADALERERGRTPEAVEAVEQEASEAPAGRGLAR